MTYEQLIEKMVEAVIEDFDFDRVHRIMVHLDWKWDIGDGIMIVPSKYRIMKEAERILTNVSKHYGEDTYSYSCGGFIAAIDGNELTLQFEVTSTTAYADDFTDNPESSESETESDDEKIKKAIIRVFTGESNYTSKEDANKYIAWLRQQGNGKSWKPTKEEMDVLYGLAYITNQYDERKEEVITRLYQDLKREFFNGSSYENMFPTNTSTEDDVRRRNTIQVLEYARSLDAYNQYGKEDIDKDIAWLEKTLKQRK